MKRATAVIGAAFGDEGKGLMTDFFCRLAGEEPLVVRFNGGAQAGHTVVCPKHGRHVFHHFGAGTFAGARTYLSRHFLVNPVLWRQEYAELQGKGLRTRLFVDREAPITTPWDMMENQRIETERGATRYGSCGAGVHQTMVRQRNPDLRLFVGDLERMSEFRTRLIDVMFHYCPTADNRGFSAAIFERFMEDCRLFASQINLCDSRVLVDRPAEIVFEGAQGLLLDQNNMGFFPHVTHSKTGLTNVMQIAAETGINEIDAVHVMRSYLTRHGAGPLPGENEGMSFFDDTNVDNPWQGKLRFAPMNPSLISEYVFKDVQNARRMDSDISIYPWQAVTHMDQCIPVISNIPSFESWGPSHTDVKDCRRR